MFSISPIPAFNDNYIWLLQTADGRAAVVDPGEAGPVIERLEAGSLRLESILVTHHHGDHQGGVGELVERYAPTVFGPANESITGRTRPLAGGELIPVLGETCLVMDVAGHTRGHLAYAFPGILFCGDTLFGAGCGRLFEGTPAQMADALARISRLPDATRIYCAHEYTALNLPFARAVEPANAALAERERTVAVQRAAGLPTVPLSLAEDRATNPFLRCDQPAVIAAARQHGAVDAGPVAVFAALRAWRNDFRAV